MSRCGVSDTKEWKAEAVVQSMDRMSRTEKDKGGSKVATAA